MTEIHMHFGIYCRRVFWTGLDKLIFTVIGDVQSLVMQQGPGATVVELRHAARSMKLV